MYEGDGNDAFVKMPLFLQALGPPFGTSKAKTISLAGIMVNWSGDLLIRLMLEVRPRRISMWPGVGSHMVYTRRQAV